MKRIASILACCVLLSGCASSSSDGREQLKIALGLKVLPASVRNIHFGEDAWTDYIVHVYCEIDPKDFPALLAGRLLKMDPSDDPFSVSPTAAKRYKIDPPDYAKSIPVFVAEEFYTWRGGGLTSCDLVTTKAHDMVYVVYGTD